MQEEYNWPKEPPGFRNLLKGVGTCGNCKHCCDTGSWDGEDWVCIAESKIEGIKDFKRHCKQIYEGPNRILTTEQFVEISTQLPKASSQCVCDLWEEIC